jgi:hypothetical protein
LALEVRLSMTVSERAAPAVLAVVHSCWLCGIRLPATSLVADGGSACADLRWYCRDVRKCTTHWTARPAKRPDLDQGTEPPVKQLAGADAAGAAPE